MNCTLTDANVYLLELNCRRRRAETKGTGGCSRDGKLRRMGPPSSCLSISGISVCAIRLGLRSLEDGRPRDGWRRDGCPRDGCSRDGGRPRRMPLRRMAPRRMSPRRMWPRRMSPRRSPLRRMSPRRMAPRRMSPRRRKSETEETDVPETEGVLLLFFCNIVESLSGSYCLIMFEWCVSVQRCVCLVDDSSGVCGWVCLGACGGAYGRKSMFCRGI